MQFHCPPLDLGAWRARLPALALGLVVIPAALRAAEPSGPLAPVIEGLQARPFEHQTGRLGADLLAGPAAAGLWNFGTGPSAAAAFLLVVEVKGQAGLRYSGRPDGGPRVSVRMVVTSRRPGGTRVLLEQSQALPLMGPDGRAFVAFLVPSDGCTPLQLSARLIGPGPQTPRLATLPLACGE